MLCFNMCPVRVGISANGPYLGWNCATTQLHQTVATLRNKQWYWDILTLSPPCSQAQCQHHVSGHTRTLLHCPAQIDEMVTSLQSSISHRRPTHCFSSDLGCHGHQIIFQTMQSKTISGVPLIWIIMDVVLLGGFIGGRPLQSATMPLR